MRPELERRVSFPVYQDTDQTDVWRLLRGRKDDIFVYDRCGKLVEYVPFPKSYLGYSFTEIAILSAYLDNRCNCSMTSHHRRRPITQRSHGRQARSKRSLSSHENSYNMLARQRNMAHITDDDLNNSLCPLPNYICQLLRKQRRRQMQLTGRFQCLCPTFTADIEEHCTCSHRDSMVTHGLHIYDQCTCNTPSLRVDEQCLCHKCGPFELDLSSSS